MTEATGSGWQLACAICKMGWPDDTEMRIVADHWDGHAGQPFTSGGQPLVAEPGKPHLDLVWGGPGPEPKPKMRQ